MQSCSSLIGVTHTRKCTLNTAFEGGARLSWESWSLSQITLLTVSEL